MQTKPLAKAQAEAKGVAKAKAVFQKAAPKAKAQSKYSKATSQMPHRSPPSNVGEEVRVRGQGAPHLFAQPEVQAGLQAEAEKEAEAQLDALDGDSDSKSGAVKFSGRQSYAEHFRQFPEEQKANLQLPKAVSKKAEVAAPAEPQQKKAPIWPYIVAGGGGLLFLMLLFALYRKKKQAEVVAEGAYHAV